MTFDDCQTFVYLLPLIFISKSTLGYHEHFKTGEMRFLHSRLRMAFVNQNRLRWWFVANTKTWIKSQKFKISPWNSTDFLFLLFSTVYNGKKRDNWLKSVLLRKDQREFLCAKILRNSIINENALNSERSLMHYKGRPSNYLFQLFFTL